ncbi:uncharacterized protein LOC126830853 isoform X2 [Patella vulgata]|uniref:uncharacterized protein LOC126830853 isoform X2 n=1 Tax=Patella vulgata TaxID=6465 RepID=UPI00217F34C2|nr:uncharacterized protein LOC126830853 isoform X2 [Patella vulgata]
MGYPKAGVNIFITCIVLVEGMADKCTTGPNIVLPCSNMTTPTNQMFIPVNGSIHTDEDNGCICNITVVELPDNIITTEVSVRIIDNNISCGYQVKAGRRIIECQNRSSSSNNIKLNESFSLLFTRDNTPSPPSTAGFCLQVITPNVNVKVTKVCREIVVRVPSPLATKPASTAKPMATTRQTMAEISNTTPLQHTMTTGASSSGAPKATISMPDTVMASLFTTEAPNTTKPVSDSLMTIPSTTETPQSRTFTVKAMSITTGNGSTASAAGVKNLATVDQLPVFANRERRMTMTNHLATKMTIHTIQTYMKMVALMRENNLRPQLIPPRLPGISTQIDRIAYLQI